MTLHQPAIAVDDLAALYRATRARTLALADGLSPEDMTVQSMEDGSPTKWHLAHTSWFFETFVLGPHAPGHASPDPRFAVLFNSYYVQAGPRFSRAQRGLITRPGVEEVLAYRASVDAAMERLLASGRAPHGLVELGCHHEMQHQELIATDLLHALSHNPLRPTYREGSAPRARAAALDWVAFEGGLHPIGHEGPGFAFDCEGPRHEQLVRPFELASRAVTNAEWIAFVEAGGYAEPTLWLSDGWAVREREGWRAPAYWWREDGRWMAFSLRGASPVDLAAPVAHVSYYEADAYARWAGARLPSEFEWEHAAGTVPRIEGTFLDDGALAPTGGAGEGLTGLWGDAWEWTASPFLPYPGFRAPEGAVGEYNGKFMVNQLVLRGGSALTPQAQMRLSYRTFFHPHQRWQMTGLRLARDVA